MTRSGRQGLSPIPRPESSIFNKGIFPVLRRLLTPIAFQVFPTENKNNGLSYAGMDCIGVNVQVF